MRDEFRRYGAASKKPPRPACNSDGENGAIYQQRPISLDLHTYSHQEAFVRRHARNNDDNGGTKWVNNHRASAHHRNRLYYSNKENAYANAYRIVKSDARRRAQMLRTKMALGSPSSSSNGGSVDFCRYLVNASKPVTLEIDGALPPYSSSTVDMDALSAASSSLSADEMATNEKRVYHRYERGRVLENDINDFDDEDLDEEEDEDRSRSLRLIGARHSYYSTSDLTTSDSEIFRHPDTKRNGVLSFSTKFPSLSTIYPNNSSNSFEDDEKLYCKEEDEADKAAKRRNLQKTKIGGPKKQLKQQQQQRLLQRQNSAPGNEAEVLRTRRRIMMNAAADRNDGVGESSLSLCTTPPSQNNEKILEMIEEISPVLPPPDANDDVDLPPVIQPLKLSKEWKPVQTSTMTDIHRDTSNGVGGGGGVALQRRLLPPPKTNPRHVGVSGTPRHSQNHHSNYAHHPHYYHNQHHHHFLQQNHQCKNGVNGGENGVGAQFGAYGSLLRRPLQKNGALSGSLEAPTPPPKSLFDPYYQDLSETCPSANDIRPEQYNLPSQLAKKLDIKGILYIKIMVTGWKLSVTIRNAAYFSKDRKPISSFVRIEIKRNKDYHKRPKYDSRLESYCSVVVPTTNRPDFYETFDFDLMHTNLRHSDKLGISVHAAATTNFSKAVGNHNGNIKDVDYVERELIGKMSFSLRKLFRKANTYQDLDGLDAPDPVKVCEGGYFLLPDKTGGTNHLSQDNILHQKYYDELGSTTISTVSSFHSGSPLKMMGEAEWRAHNSAFNTINHHAASYGMAGNPSDITYCRFEQQHRMPSGTMSAGNGSPCKKPMMTSNTMRKDACANCENADLMHHAPSASHLMNLHQAISTRFTRAKKSSAPTAVSPVVYAADEAHVLDYRGETTTTTTKLGGTCCKNAPQMGAAKNDGNVVNLDYTIASTSSSSGTSSSIEYKRRHRCTLPSITTTMTDTTTSDYSNGDSIENRQEVIDYHLLYAEGVRRQEKERREDALLQAAEMDAASVNSKADEKEDNQISRNNTMPTRGLTRKERFSSQKHSRDKTSTITNETKKDEKKHVSVRRVASFTFSPESSKHNKRIVAGPTRKFTLGPLGKTFSYLRSKMDLTNSTSALYVSREECKQWQESFEALLNHKYGCHLFRQFLNQECSVENLDFWIECEEFKKMKDGKKNTAQKAEFIFNTYVMDGSEKEVNLDSATKSATKAAIKTGIHADTFNLAQTKIEQLMSKDSYQRFLKWEPYLELLNNTSSNVRNTGSLRRLSASDDASPRMKRTGSGRNESLSVGGTLRRHTCVPEQTETLAMQEIASRARQGRTTKNDDGAKALKTSVEKLSESNNHIHDNS